MSEIQAFTFGEKCADELIKATRDLPAGHRLNRRFIEKLIDDLLAQEQPEPSDDLPLPVIDEWQATLAKEVATTLHDNPGLSIDGIAAVILSSYRQVYRAAQEQPQVGTRGVCLKCGLPFTDLPARMTCHREQPQAGGGDKERFFGTHIKEAVAAIKPLFRKDNPNPPQPAERLEAWIAIEATDVLNSDGPVYNIWTGSKSLLLYTKDLDDAEAICEEHNAALNRAVEPLQKEVQELREELKTSENATNDLLEVLEDKRRLTAELGRIIYGNGAAKQPSLCDLIGPVKSLTARLEQATTDLQVHAIAFHVNPEHGNYYRCMICHHESKDSNLKIEHGPTCSLAARASQSEGAK